MLHIPKRTVLPDPERHKLSYAAECEQTAGGMSGLMASDPRRDEIPIGIAQSAYARLPNPATNPLQQQCQAERYPQQKGQQL